MRSFTTRQLVCLAAAGGLLTGYLVFNGRPPPAERLTPRVPAAQPDRLRVRATGAGRSDATESRLAAGLIASAAVAARSTPARQNEGAGDSTPPAARWPADATAVWDGSGRGRLDATSAPPRGGLPTSPHRPIAAGLAETPRTSTEEAPIATDTAEPPPLIVPFSVKDRAQTATIPASLSHTVIGSDPSGAAEVARLADRFAERVTGGSEDPRDPEYQQRWTDAQEENDSRMRASLGGQAWLTHHLKVHRDAAVQPPPAPPTGH